MTSQVQLWSLPRSGCHLLERILSKQSNVDYLLHPYEASRPPQRDALNSSLIANGSFPDNFVPAYLDGLQKSLSRWEKALSESQRKNRILFMHEHPFMAVLPDFLLKETSETSSPPINFTNLPDEVLLHPGTVPIITIRHPVLQTKSVLKAILLHQGESVAEQECLITSDWGWARLLYDYLVYNGIEPLVVDADDFMTSEAFNRQICARAGLNVDEAIFQWPKTSKEEQQKLHPLLRSVQATMFESEGLVSGRAAKNIDLEMEMEGWSRNFSERSLEILHKMYERALPNWEYLYARRMKSE